MQYGTLCLLNVFTTLKRSFIFNFIIRAPKVVGLFAITAAGVVPRGGRKKSSRTSSIAHIIFFIWLLLINGNILVI